MLSASKGYREDLGVGRHFGNWEWQCCPGDHCYYLTLHLELVLELKQIQWPGEDEPVGVSEGLWLPVSLFTHTCVHVCI